MSDENIESGARYVHSVPLRRRKDRHRAELIHDVVDAFARLRDSVSRFIAMLSGQAFEPLASEAADPQRFGALLSSLAVSAERAAFPRLVELERLIERAREAERHRDVIFARSPAGEDTALREAAAVLERLDTALVGLCVEHMLEHHAHLASSTRYEVFQR